MPDGDPVDISHNPSAVLVEPRRVLMTSLECDTLGPPVWRAVHQMVLHGEIAAILDLLDRAPQGSTVAEKLWPRITTRENVRRLLREEYVAPGLIDRMVERLGVDMIEPLLEGLEMAESRAIRRKMLDVLGRFGTDAMPLVVQRLTSDRPWFVKRNLLVLLNKLSDLPADFEPAAFLSDGDPRVRREALKLLLKIPERREQAILTALKDGDERVLRLALSSASESFPGEALKPIKAIADDPMQSADVRTAAIRAAASSRFTGSVAWLTRFAAAERQLFLRKRLAVKSPEMIAALSALSAFWRSDLEAMEILTLAEQSTEAEVRAAVRAGSVVESRKA